MTALAIPLASAPTLEVVLFGAFALLAVGSSLIAALAPRIVHAALGLLGTFLAVAGLYALLGADFVALAQVLVYVGGILVLLVFGVLLTGRALSLLGLERRPSIVFPSIAGGLLVLGLLLATFGTRWPVVGARPAPEPTTSRIGHALLDPKGDLVAFELASILLLAALVGAAYLVRRRREG